jgi:hypothetical protein
MDFLRLPFGLPKYQHPTETSQERGCQPEVLLNILNHAFESPYSCPCGEGESSRQHYKADSKGNDHREHLADSAHPHTPHAVFNILLIVGRDIPKPSLICCRVLPAASSSRI